MEKKLVVGAIDFGTTYSGWAFSFLHDYNCDPTRVTTNHWYSGGNLVSEKTPTCVLIQPDGRTLEAFGYEAENRYVELAEDGRHKEFYFFKKFKMALHKKLDEVIDRYITIKDAMGRPLPAMEVFALAIEYLVNSLMRVGQDRTLGLSKDDFQWVITVPAIWSDSAKQFMREAAVQAGIDNDNLLIALEPEAASVYCRHIPFERSQVDTEAAFLSLQPETKYMIIDAGGGTVDITVHKLNQTGGLEEVFSASGGGWGGSVVDIEFEMLLIEITNKSVYEEFKMQHTDDWVDLWRDFEMKKKSASPQMEKRIVVKIPTSLFQLFRETTKKCVEDQIAASRYAGSITVTLDKLIMESKVFKELFTKSVDKTIQHLKSTFSGKEMKEISAILMVGGFSDSKILQNAVKMEFKPIRVICPGDAVTAVMKGAVLFGHDPDAIAARVLKFTYGYEAAVPFVEGIHPQRLKIENEHGTQCANGFLVYAKCHDTIKCGESQVSVCISPQFSHQTWINIPIYATDCKPPEYIDASLTRVGEITVELEDHDCDIDREVELSLKFDSTEIVIQGKDTKTGHTVKSKIDFLG